MPFSIAEYKRRLQVRAAQAQRRGHPLPSADLVYAGLQKKYLDFCVDKNLNPDHKLLTALKTDSFVLKLDAFAHEELAQQMEFLQRCSGLSQIALSIGSVTMDRDMRKKFERLGLTKSPALTKEGAAMIVRSVCSACAKSPSLTRLQLLGTLIADSQAVLIAKVLMKCDLIESVNLACTKLGDKGLENLVMAIGRRPHLTYVNLSSCQLTEKAKLHLSKIISLHGAIRDEAAWSSSLRGAIPQQTEKRPALMLDLSLNNIGDAAIEPLCTALYHDKWLLGLNLVQTNLSVAGWTLLRDTLQHSNATLSVLRLSEQVESAAAKTIRRCIDQITNKRARYLHRLAADSNERRLYLCNVLVEWKLEHDTVLQICEGSHAKSPTVTAETLLASNQEGEQSNELRSYSYQTGQPDTDHIHTITFLVDRLSALETEQRNTAQYIARLEEENQRLQVQVAALSADQHGVTPVEEQIISRLEGSISTLARQIEGLERQQQ